MAEGFGAIQTMNDLTKKKWLWQDIENINYQNITDMARILPENMKLIILSHDIFTYVWENMGFVHFCNSIYEDEELIEEFFGQIGEAIYKINERTAELAGNKIGAFWYADDLAFNTGTFVNPEIYRKHLFPWVRKISRTAKELGVPFIYHTDGRLWTLFDDFYEIGVNAIQPLEPNSMIAEEVKQKQGYRFCLIGNIDIDRLSRGTSEEIDAMVKDRIEKLGYNGGYCVGSSNTLPSYVNPVNFGAMVEATFKYGT